jgi:hypothetical protein
MNENIQKLIQAVEDALLTAYEHYDYFKDKPDLLSSYDNVQKALASIKAELK